MPEIIYSSHFLGRCRDRHLSLSWVQQELERKRFKTMPNKQHKGEYIIELSGKIRMPAKIEGKAIIIKSIWEVDT